MGITEKLSRKTGVIVGDDVLRLFEYAQEKQFAIPAIVSNPSPMRAISLDLPPIVINPQAAAAAAAGVA